MKITKRRIIILTVLITLMLLCIYLLKSGSESFAILEINDLDSINDPALNVAIEATEECNKVEISYRHNCYSTLSLYLGKNYGSSVCEKLKDELKPICYAGYGRSIGEKYSPNIKLIQKKCSRIIFFEQCLIGASQIIGEESSKHIETEQCKKFKQENIKQRCYQGIGKQLSRDNKELSLCEKIEGKEECLGGFAFITDGRGNRKEALQICLNLDEKIKKTCYYFFGQNNVRHHGYNNRIWGYNKTIKEAFKDCEQYPYPEDCKRGVASGVAAKFFREKQ